jgi:hypothetical protein
MAVPVIQSRSEKKEATNVTSTTITAPSGITDGDLLLIVSAFDGPAGSDLTALTIPAGFEQFILRDEGSVTIIAMWKIASSESGNYTISWSSQEQVISEMYRIDGITSDSEYVIFNPGETAESNGAASSLTITPLKGTDTNDMLIFACFGIDDGDADPGAGGDADYTLEDADNSGTASGDVGIAVQTQSQATSGTVPDPCTYTPAASEGIAALWFGVRSLTPGGTGPKIQSKSLEVHGQVTSATVTAPSGIVDNDLLLLFISWDGNSGNGTVTPPTGFNEEYVIGNNPTSATVTGAIYSKVASSESGDYAISWTGVNEHTATLMLRIDGVASGSEIQNPAEEGNSTVATTNPFITPATATDTDNSLVFAFAVNDDGQDIEPGRMDATEANYIVRHIFASAYGNVGNGFHLAEKYQGTAGTPERCDFELTPNAEEWGSCWLAVRSESPAGPAVGPVFPRPLNSQPLINW